MLDHIQSRTIRILSPVFLISIASILFHQNIAEAIYERGENSKLYVNQSEAQDADKIGIRYKFYTTSEALDSPRVPLEPQSRAQPLSFSLFASQQELDVEDESRISINSISDLLDHLNATNKDNFDPDSIVDFVNTSGEAFDHIASEFLLTEDLWLKEQLLSILDNVNREEKAALALDMLFSQESRDRTKAYEWLSRSEKSDSSEVYGVLIDAIYSEENPHALNKLIAMVNIPDAAIDLNAHNRAVFRLRELAQYADEYTALNALSKIAEISNNDETLDFLHSFIHSSSLDIRKTAIEGLSSFSNPGEDVMRTLNTIMENPSEPQELRVASVRAIVEFENHISTLYPD